MPNFKEFIKGFEEKPEAQQPMQEQPAQEQPKEKRQHLPLYSNERRYIPATKTKYEKVGGKWQQMGEPETKNYTKEQAGNFFDKKGLPFEGGHRFEKKNLAHSEKYDTATVYNPDKTQKMVVDVDYEAGNKAFDKIRNKSLYDRERYKKMKEARAAAKQGNFQETFGNMEEEPKAEEPKEDIYTINPQWANVEYDEDYERSYGEGANADDIEFEMSENPEIYEGKTRHQIVAALSNRLNTHPDKIRELLGKPQQEAKSREGSFQQAFGGEQEEQEQDERAELFQKYLDMGYDKGDAQFKVQEVLNRRENAKKEEEFEKLASVGTAFADNGEITINTPWSRNRRNNYKNYLELRSYLDENYGQGNYAIDYLQDETRDNGRETSAKLKVRLY